MSFKYSMESQSQNYSVKILPFSPEVLKQNKELHEDLVGLWLQLDKAESKYDAKYGLTSDSSEDLTDFFRKRLASSSGYYLEAEDKTIGFCMVKDAEYQNAYFISCLVIDESHRGWGLGKVLIDYVFKKKKPKRALLRVSMNNPAGLALYKKCGFEPISQVMMKTK